MKAFAFLAAAVLASSAAIVGVPLLLSGGDGSAALACATSDPPNYTPIPGATLPAGPLTAAGSSLDTAQRGNAGVIIETGRNMSIPPRGWVIAIATSMQEAGLRNLPYGDRDSLGLFQQRPSQGWGTPTQILDPAYAATQFYTHLQHVPGWQQLPLTAAAQAVQQSAYPDAYAKWQPLAEALINLVTTTQPATPTTTVTAAPTTNAAPIPSTVQSATSADTVSGMASAVAGPTFWTGDSLTVGLRPYLTGSWIYDAATGRTTNAEIVALANHAGQPEMTGNAPWVVSLGTNDYDNTDAFATAAAHVLDAAGTARQVYWYDIWIGTKAAESAAINTALASLAATRPNLHILGWAALAQANPTWFSSDTSGIHPTPAGYKARYQLAVDALAGDPASTTTTCSTTGTGSITTTGGWAFPIDRGLVTLTALSNPHHDYPAIDILVPQGTPAYALTAGTVTNTDTFNQNWYIANCDTTNLTACATCGTGATITTPAGIRYTYCHGSILHVNKGDHVEAGQLILDTGNTGRSSGPHLHIEIRTPDNTQHCPQTLLQALYNNQPPPQIGSLPIVGCFFTTTGSDG